MSTRSSIALCSEGQATMHLYNEMHDGEVHLEIDLEQSNIRLNLVIPKPLVAGVSAILKRAEGIESLDA